MPRPPEPDSKNTAQLWSLRRASSTTARSALSSHQPSLRTGPWITQPRVQNGRKSSTTIPPDSAILDASCTTQTIIIEGKSFRMKEDRLLRMAEDRPTLVFFDQEAIGEGERVYTGMKRWTIIRLAVLRSEVSKRAILRRKNIRPEDAEEDPEVSAAGHAHLEILIKGYLD